MEVYKLEFNFFSGVSWDGVTIVITAITKIQLMKAFIEETHYMNESRTGHTKKELWNYNKQYITNELLTFPLIERL